MRLFVRFALAGTYLGLCLACPSPMMRSDAGNIEIDGGSSGGGMNVLADGGSGGGNPTGGRGGTSGGGTGEMAESDGGSAQGGGAGGGTPFDAGIRIALPDFCEAWARAYCDREASCLYLDSAQGMTCLARAKETCSAWQRRVAAGTYGYEPTEGAHCVTATRSFSCVLGRGFLADVLNFDFGNGADACTKLLVGVGGENTPCSSAADCAAGFRCTGSAATCQVCTALPTVGEACTPQVPCFNAACRAAGDGGLACFSYALAGEACDAGDGCEPQSTLGCGDAPSDGGPRVCVMKGADGTVCGRHEVCSSGFCNNGHRTDAGARTCGHIALGRPCATQTDCEPTAFCNGLTNTAIGVCTPRIAVNMPCTIQRSADLHDGCADEGNCFEGICKLRHNQQRSGQNCRSSALDCAPGLWCPALPNDGGYPLCVTQAAEGQACASMVECGPGLRCTNNVCQRLGSLGSRCFAHQFCKDTLICPLVDAGMGFYACSALVGVGGSCSVSGSTCASGMDNGQGGFCARDGGGASCVAPLGLGGDCGSSGQCASGRCLRADGGIVSSPLRGSCQPSCFP